MLNKAEDRHWYLLSQMLSSATNVLLTIWVATSVGVEEFGSFATVSAGYLVAVGYLRSAVLTPLLADEAHNDSTGIFTSLALRTSIPFSALFAIASLMVPSSLRTGTLVLAFAMPVLLRHDGFRYAAFGSRDPRYAALLDLRWLLSTIVFLGVARLLGAETYEVGLVLWVAAAAIALLWGADEKQQSLATTSSIARSRTVRGMLALEHTLRTGSLQGALFVVGSFGLLDQVAGVRGAMTLTAPLMLAANSFTPMWTKRYTTTVATHAFRPAAALMGGAFLAGLALVVTPAEWYEVALGDSALATHAALPCIGLALVCEATATPLSAALRARFRLWPLVGARVVYSIILALGVVYAGSVEPRGLAWAIALGETVALVFVAVAVPGSISKR